MFRWPRSISNPPIHIPHSILTLPNLPHQEPIRVSDTQPPNPLPLSPATTLFSPAETSTKRTKPAKNSNRRISKEPSPSSNLTSKTTLPSPRLSSQSPRPSAESTPSSATPAPPRSAHPVEKSSKRPSPQTSLAQCSSQKRLSPCSSDQRIRVLSRYPAD